MAKSKAAKAPAAPAKASFIGPPMPGVQRAYAMPPPAKQDAAIGEAVGSGGPAKQAAAMAPPAQAGATGLAPKARIAMDESDVAGRPASIPDAARFKNNNAIYSGDKGGFVNPKSEQGQRIQATLDRQQVTKYHNEVQKAHFKRVTGAKDGQTAMNIQKSAAKGGLGTFGVKTDKSGRIISKTGVLGVPGMAQPKIGSHVDALPFSHADQQAAKEADRAAAQLADDSAGDTAGKFGGTRQSDAQKLGFAHSRGNDITAEMRADRMTHTNTRYNPYAYLAKVTAHPRPEVRQPPSTSLLKGFYPGRAPRTGNKTLDAILSFQRDRISGNVAVADDYARIGQNIHAGITGGKAHTAVGYERTVLGSAFEAATNEVQAWFEGKPVDYVEKDGKKTVYVDRFGFDDFMRETSKKSPGRIVGELEAEAAATIGTLGIGAGVKFGGRVAGKAAPKLAQTIKAATVKKAPKNFITAPVQTSAKPLAGVTRPAPIKYGGARAPVPKRSDLASREIIPRPKPKPVADMAQRPGGSPRPVGSRSRPAAPKPQPKAVMDVAQKPSLKPAGKSAEVQPRPAPKVQPHKPAGTPPAAKPPAGKPSAAPKGRPTAKLVEKPPIKPRPDPADIKPRPGAPRGYRPKGGWTVPAAAVVRSPRAAAKLKEIQPRASAPTVDDAVPKTVPFTREAAEAVTPTARQQQKVQTINRYVSQPQRRGGKIRTPLIIPIPDSWITRVTPTVPAPAPGTPWVPSGYDMSGGMWGRVRAKGKRKVTEWGNNTFVNSFAGFVRGRGDVSYGARAGLAVLGKGGGKAASGGRRRTRRTRRAAKRTPRRGGSDRYKALRL